MTRNKDFIEIYQTAQRAVKLEAAARKLLALIDDGDPEAVALLRQRLQDLKDAAVVLRAAMGDESKATAFACSDCGWTGLASDCIMSPAYLCPECEGEAVRDA